LYTLPFRGLDLEELRTSYALDGPHRFFEGGIDAIEQVSIRIVLELSSGTAPEAGGAQLANAEARRTRDCINLNGFIDPPTPVRRA
jgi:hypothetical protein